MLHLACSFILLIISYSCAWGGDSLASCVSSSKGNFDLLNDKGSYVFTPPCLYFLSKEKYTRTDAGNFKEHFNRFSTLKALGKAIKALEDEVCPNGTSCINELSKDSYEVVYKDCPSWGCTNHIVVYWPKPKKIAHTPPPVSPKKTPAKPPVNWETFKQRYESAQSTDFETMKGFATEVQMMSGIRAHHFFLGLPVELSCRPRSGSLRNDPFILQEQCPYDSFEAYNTAQHLNSEGYTNLANLFYTRAAADIRNLSSARSSLKSITGALPWTSDELKACIHEVCSKTNPMPEICQQLETNSGSCFLAAPLTQ